MLRVMIVDDEKLVRIGLSNALDWNANGFTIVGEAGNGQVALELARSLHPHIILTDIRMPKMNGLEMIKILKEESPHIKFVILSAYDEFDYARQALHLGASEYILKLSMEPEKLLEIMKTLQQDIERESEIYMNNVESDISNTEHQIEYRGSLVRKLLTENPATLEYDQNHYYTLIKTQVIVAYLSVPNIYGFVNLSSIVKVLSDVFQSADVRLFSENDNQFGVLFYGEECADHDSLLKKCDILRCNLLSYSEFVMIAVGESVSTVSGLAVALRNAKAAMDYAFYGRSRVFNVRDATPLDLADNDIFWAELRDDVRNNRHEYIEHKVLSYLSELRGIPKYNPQSLCKVVTRLLHRYADMLNLPDAVAEIPSAANIHIDKLYEWVVSFFSECSAKRAAFYNEDISLALEYIDAHYTENLRLKDLSEILYKNESYISHLFTKNMGVSFSAYITRIKVQKAKFLLMSTHDRLPEIASRVGYNDVTYFCRVFRKQTGMSPEQYRRKKG